MDSNGDDLHPHVSRAMEEPVTFTLEQQEWIAELISSCVADATSRYNSLLPFSTTPAGAGMGSSQSVSLPTPMSTQPPSVSAVS